MGRAVVEWLVKTLPGRVVVADRRQLCPRAVFPFNSSRIEYKKLEAHSYESVKRAVEGSALVVNCAGPFAKQGPTLTKILIELGHDCIDICNSPGVTRGILDLDALAQEREVRVITGMGFTPGLSNLLVMRAAGGMECVESVRIHWVGSVHQEGGESLLRHMITLSSERVPLYLSRKRTWVRAFSDPEPEKFPHPIGWVSCKHTGHPEVITLPSYLDADQIAVKGTLSPVWAEHALELLGRAGVSQVERLRTKSVGALASLARLRTSLYGPNGQAGLKVSVHGRKQGQPVVISMNTMGPLRTLTAIPVVVATRMMLSGEIRRPGVFPPEGCVDEAKALMLISRLGLVYTFSEHFLPTPEEEEH